MKKIILLICATTLFVSCSKSSSDDAPVAPIATAGNLITRVETTGNGVTRIENVTYNVNKIVKVSSAGNNETRYTYVGNLISLSENLDNNVLTGSTAYTYTNDKLTGINRIEISTSGPTPITYRSRISFTDNNDGTIGFIRFTTNNVSNVETQIGSGTYTFLNGNLIKEQYTSSTYNEIITYTYDSKNNAIRNILGFDKLIDNEQFSLNNVLTSNQSTNETPIGAASFVTTSNNSYAYVYNVNNYVTSETRTQTRTNPFSGTNSTVDTTLYFY